MISFDSVSAVGASDGCLVGRWVFAALIVGFAVVGGLDGKRVGDVEGLLDGGNVGEFDGAT